MQEKDKNSPETKESISEEGLQELLNEQGIEWNEVKNRIGSKYGQISSCCRGIPNLLNLIKIAQAIDVDFSKLMEKILPKYSQFFLQREKFLEGRIKELEDQLKMKEGKEIPKNVSMSEEGLRKLLDERSMSWKDLREKTGIAYRTPRDLCRKVPSLITVLKISKALDIEFPKLMNIILPDCSDYYS